LTMLPPEATVRELTVANATINSRMNHIQWLQPKTSYEHRIFKEHSYYASPYSTLLLPS